MHEEIKDDRNWCVVGVQMIKTGLKRIKRSVLTDATCARRSN
jgi:hypothetical protein